MKTITEKGASRISVKSSSIIYTRKCLRCETLVVEDLVLMAANGEYAVDVREKGILKSSLGKIKCAACPECGYVETYIENTGNIKELVAENN